MMIAPCWLVLAGSLAVEVAPPEAVPPSGSPIKHPSDPRLVIPEQSDLPPGYVVGQDGFVHGPLERYLRGELTHACQMPVFEQVANELASTLVVDSAEAAMSRAKEYMGCDDKKHDIHMHATMCRLTCDTTPFLYSANAGQLFWAVKIDMQAEADRELPAWLTAWSHVREWTVLIRASDATVVWIRSNTSGEDRPITGMEGPPSVGEMNARQRGVVGMSSISNVKSLAECLANVVPAIRKMPYGGAWARAREVIVLPVQIEVQQYGGDGRPSTTVIEPCVQVELRGMWGDGDALPSTWPGRIAESPWYDNNHATYSLTLEGRLVGCTNGRQMLYDSEEWRRRQQEWLSGLDKDREAVRDYRQQHGSEVPK
jgi:hypothetical protein